MLTDKFDAHDIAPNISQSVTELLIEMKRLGWIKPVTLMISVWLFCEAWVVLNVTPEHRKKY